MSSRWPARRWSKRRSLLLAQVTATPSARYTMVRQNALVRVAYAYVRMTTGASHARAYRELKTI